MKDIRHELTSYTLPRPSAWYDQEEGRVITVQTVKLFLAVGWSDGEAERYGLGWDNYLTLEFDVRLHNAGSYSPPLTEDDRKLFARVGLEDAACGPYAFRVSFGLRGDVGEAQALGAAKLARLQGAGGRKLVRYLNRLFEEFSVRRAA